MTIRDLKDQIDALEKAGFSLDEEIYILSVGLIHVKSLDADDTKT